MRRNLVTYTLDDYGFDKSTAMLRAELDAGRPVVVDFKCIGPQYPGGLAGLTLSVCGYIDAENLYIVCNPAVANPSLQLITTAAPCRSGCAILANCVRCLGCISAVEFHPPDVTNICALLLP